MTNAQLKSTGSGRSEDGNHNYVVTATVYISSPSLVYSMCVCVCVRVSLFFVVTHGLTILSTGALAIMIGDVCVCVCLCR